MTDAYDGTDEGAAKGPWTTRLLIGIPVGIVALCLLGGMFSDDEDSPDEGNRLDAERVCEEDFIAKRLKAPSTADYDLTGTGGPTTFTVSGTVDAENSFGAKLRMDVTCVVSIADDSRWKLVSLAGIE